MLWFFCWLCLLFLAVSTRSNHKQNTRPPPGAEGQCWGRGPQDVGALDCGPGAQLRFEGSEDLHRHRALPPSRRWSIWSIFYNILDMSHGTLIYTYNLFVFGFLIWMSMDSFLDLLEKRIGMKYTWNLIDHSWRGHISAFLSYPIFWMATWSPSFNWISWFRRTTELEGNKPPLGMNCTRSSSWKHRTFTSIWHAFPEKTTWEKRWMI